MKGGATIWARKTIDSDIFYWKSHVWFKIWFFIVNKVNHKDNKHFKRGTNLFNFQIDKAQIRCTADQWKKCIAWLRSEGMIRTNKSTRGNIITVIKYNTYQDLNNYTSTTTSTTEAQQKHNRSTTINKYDKNEKNDKYSSEHSSQDINPLIALFKDVNPSYEKLFKNKSQRAALLRLVEKHGFAKLSAMIEFLQKSNKERYAPTITTPCQLEDKLGQLIVWAEKEKGNKVQII